MDFLDAIKCTFEMAKKVLCFPNRGVSISLKDPSLQTYIVQARVTGTLSIPPFSKMEVMAKFSDGLHPGNLAVRGVESKNLPVRVAHVLVNPATMTVPVRLLNLSSDTSTVLKGTYR